MHLRHLSRLLALLLGIFCLGGACELDAKECKQNYGKESLDYVLAAAVDAHDAALHLAPLPDAPACQPRTSCRLCPSSRLHRIRNHLANSVFLNIRVRTVEARQDVDFC